MDEEGGLPGFIPAALFIFKQALYFFSIRNNA
jgi:hypothetical protein